MRYPIAQLRLPFSGGSAQIARDRLLTVKGREGTRPGLPAYSPPTDTSPDLLRRLLDQNDPSGKGRS